MEDKINSAITDEKINVPVSREVLRSIAYSDVPEADAGLGERVDNILRSHLYEREEGENEYGDPQKGYQWGNAFLPNGSKLSTVYKNKKHYATVKFGKVIYEGESCSPPGLASEISKGTARYAWEDLFIKLHGSDVWERVR